MQAVGKYRWFWENHLDFLNRYGDFENGISVIISLPKIYPELVLQNLRGFY